MQQKNNQNRDTDDKSGKQDQGAGLGGAKKDGVAEGAKRRTQGQEQGQDQDGGGGGSGG
jgi:hypothetical protein